LAAGNFPVAFLRNPPAPGSLGIGDMRQERLALTVGCHCEQQQEEDTMDKDRIKGSAEQVKGKIKEVAGKVTGDAKLESEGKADKAAGKIQNTVGGIKDAVKESVDE